jgi:hypothetical protein
MQIKGSTYAIFDTHHIGPLKVQQLPWQTSRNKSQTNNTRHTSITSSTNEQVQHFGLSL